MKVDKFGGFVPSWKSNNSDIQFVVQHYNITFEGVNRNIISIRVFDKSISDEDWVYEMSIDTNIFISIVTSAIYGFPLNIDGNDYGDFSEYFEKGIMPDWMKNTKANEDE